MRRVVLTSLVSIVFVAVVVGGYLITRRGSLAPDAATYEAFTRTFFSGLASLQVGLLDNAKRDFGRATELVPEEPAGWANLGLAQIRLGELDLAVPAIERAVALAPESSEAELLFGQLEVARGRLEEGIAHFRRAVDLDPRSLRPRAALAQEVERAGAPTADADAQRLFEELLELRPDNLAVLLERTRLAVKRDDVQLLQDSLGRLAKYEGTWPAVAVEQYRALQAAARARSSPDAARAVAFLRNVLVRVPAFREGLTEIRVPSELIADPFDRFLKLPAPSAAPSPADTALAYSREAPGDRPTASAALVAFVPNGGQTDVPVVFAADGREMRQLGPSGATWLFPGGTSAVPPTGSGLLALDWNRDFKMDVVMAGRGGLRLLAQGDAGTFVDSTPAAEQGVPPLFRADVFGVWTADIEMDGDLDLIVGVNEAPPLALRNNGDGTWRSVQPFTGLLGVRAFAWGDLDQDGDPDAAVLDRQGHLGVFENRQGGEFRPIVRIPDSRRSIALAVGDANGDGTLDVVTVDETGLIRRASMNRERGWQHQQIAVWPDVPRDADPGTYRVFLADLDNNGALDLVVSGSGSSRIWLATDRRAFQPLQATPEGEVFGVLDFNGDGQLDLLGLANGQPTRWLGRGAKGYHWHLIRPRAQQVAGDQRINTFGLGGDIEIRSGLLTQRQTMTGAPVHFGLGTRTTIDVTRIVWPNGVLQADFEQRVGEPVVAEQRLKGSCPWVFAYDGTGMRFVTDFLWRRSASASMRRTPPG
jgi:tetratricopeptide (TPR) repeat protein